MTAAMVTAMAAETTVAKTAAVTAAAISKSNGNRKKSAYNISSDSS